MHAHARLIALLLVIITLNCANSVAMAQQDCGVKGAVSYLPDIIYGVADGVELRLDIAIPATAKESNGRYPLLIFIHGGGWQTGGRGAYRGRIQKSAERGYVAASISHRLTAEKDEEGRPIHPWPAAIHDCKAAVRFLKTYADHFYIDPNRIGVTGASSGGHLSLLLGLTDASAGLEGQVKLHTLNGARMEPVADTSVHAVFNKSGPTELVSCYKAKIVTPFLEDLLGAPDSNPDGYEQASPIRHISDGDPPVMTIHGELDHVVPVDQARQLNAAMRKAGLRHQYLELSGEKHVFTRPSGSRYWDAFYAFMDRELKEP